MVRTYDPDRPVARAVIDDLLELAIRAPSAGFTQGWRFLVLDDPPVGRLVLDGLHRRTSRPTLGWHGCGLHPR